MTRAAWRLVVVTALFLALMSMTARANAHGGNETKEGYLLVQQALAHLAHDTSPDGVELAMEKVDDALATDDQEGVDVVEVREGMDALEAGDVGRARMLLEDSIVVALADQPLATGYETGTGLIPSELPGRGTLGVGDWLLLGLSVAVAGVGLWLSVRFRPHDSVGALRVVLSTKPDTDHQPEDSAGVPSVRHQP